MSPAASREHCILPKTFLTDVCELLTKNLHLCADTVNRGMRYPKGQENCLFPHEMLPLLFFLHFVFHYKCHFLGVLRLGVTHRCSVCQQVMNLMFMENLETFLTKSMLFLLQMLLCHCSKDGKRPCVFNLRSSQLTTRSRCAVNITQLL